MSEKMPCPPNGGKEAYRIHWPAGHTTTVYSRAEHDAVIAGYRSTNGTTAARTAQATTLSGGTPAAPATSPLLVLLAVLITAWVLVRHHIRGQQ